MSAPSKVSIFLLGIFVVVWGFSAASAEEGYQQESMMHASGIAVGTALSASSEEISKTDYTCSMCPDVHADTPGNCPQCGMTLVAETSEKSAVVDMSNDICPVSGKEVSGKNFYVYNNTRYGFCCDMCIMKFQKNPEKYLKI